MTTQINWQATGVTGCNIHGSNDDAWICTGAACANDSHTSTAITAQTTYTLSCAVSGQPNIVKSTTVNVTPIYQEQ
jgi:hypothetical protein